MGMTREIAMIAAADRRYAEPLMALTASVLAHLGPRCRVELHLVNDWSAAQRAEFSARFAGTRLTPVWIDGAALPVGPGWLAPAHLGAPAFWRMFAGRFVGARFDRAVYVDADVILRRCLSELHDADLAGKTIGAVRDYALPEHHLSGGVASAEIGLDPMLPYFNSGVMVLDLARWRRERVEERLVAYASVPGRRLPFADQDALNAVLAFDWRPLDPRWNRQSAIDHLHGRPMCPPFPLRVRLAIRAAAFAVHASGGPKPWEAGYEGFFREPFLRWQRAPRRTLQAARVDDLSFLLRGIRGLYRSGFRRLALELAFEIPVRLLRQPALGAALLTIALRNLRGRAAAGFRSKF